MVQAAVLIVQIIRTVKLYADHIEMQTSYNYLISEPELLYKILNGMGHKIMIKRILTVLNLGKLLK